MLNSALRLSPSLLAILLCSLGAFGCAAPVGVDEGSASAEDDLAAKADQHWFYGGAIPALEEPKITVSLKGHTARLTGFLPAAETLPDLPHVKVMIEGGRTRIDAVYPIATARSGKTNAAPGEYAFQLAKPYRPDGSAFTPVEGVHYVPWGGFPFLAYDDGIALHGPITSTANPGGDLSVWVLKRGEVSGGCNRMMGEHVVELAHAIGVNMRKVYLPNVGFVPKSPAAVEVIADYDSYDGKLVDVDYPTDVGVVRPGKVVGDANVVMFGSWVASQLPSGADLPPNMKWQGGVAGQYYVFADHVLPNVVCSASKADLPKLRTYVSHSGELPLDFCAKEACYLKAIRAGVAPSCGD